MPSPISPSIIGQREKFLIYGDPGMLKTYTSLTAPGPIYHMSIGGPNEAKTYYSNYFQKNFGSRLKPEMLLTDFVVEEVDRKGRFKDPKAFDDCCSKLDIALEQDDKGEIHFETVVIDNATILSAYQMNKVIKLSDLGRQDNSKDSSYKKFQEEGILKPTDSDWGGSQSLMDKFVSWLFSLDKHIVLIAHEWEQTVANRATQSQDTVAIKPLFVGKQRDKIANMFDNVWRMYKTGQLFAARTEPAEKPYTVIAKTRVGGVLEKDYPSPDLSDAISKFQKHASKFATVSPNLPK